MVTKFNNKKNLRPKCKGNLLRGWTNTRRPGREATKEEGRGGSRVLEDHDEKQRSDLKWLKLGKKKKKTKIV